MLMMTPRYVESYCNNPDQSIENAENMMTRILMTR